MNSSMICQFPESKPTIPNTLCNAKNLRSRPPPKFLGVLIVDDNESRGIANAEMISRFGHAVDLAQDGISALRMAAANQPDVVLLNTDLRNLDDCDVARRLRFDYPERPPLIIGLASRTNSLTRWQCVNAGMDLVFEAPLDAEAIETVLLFECAKLTVEKNSGSSIRLQRRRVCIPAKPNTVVASHSGYHPEKAQHARESHRFCVSINRGWERNPRYLQSAIIRTNTRKLQRRIRDERNQS